jgi:hypothetical protein
MGASTRDLVRARARDRCEYCLLPQDALPVPTFHVEHVRAKQHGGSDEPNNLALACDRCNYHKGTNLTGVDPQTNNIALLFNPRVDSWSEHFRITRGRVIGLTDVGRATVAVLNMNAPRRVKLRLQIKLTAP